jgi:acetyltransferase-like isoleucine patch superfamily enzyme
MFRMRMISVLALTKNEEQDLRGCLDSVEWSDDVHGFDLFSTERTAEIARSAGAQVTQRVFDGYASQRNAAPASLPFRHEWIFLPDADGRPTPELIEEMQRAAAAAPAEVAAFRVRRRDFLNGRWLKYAQISPFCIHLVRRGRAHSLTMGSHCIVSQGAYICGATHQYSTREFRLVHFPMRLGAYSWIWARATVNPGVNVGAGAILALGSVATQDPEPFGICAGIPARKVKERLRSGVPMTDDQPGL